MSRKARAFPEKITWDVDDNSKLSFKTHKMFSWHLSRLLKDIEREARRIVEVNHPDGTGALKKSIHSDGVSQKTRGSRFVHGSVSAGSSNAPYAKYVHGRSATSKIGMHAHTRTRPGPASDKYLFWWAGNGGVLGKPKKFYVKTVHLKDRAADPFLRTAARTVIAQRRS